MGILLQLYFKNLFTTCGCYCINNSEDRNAYQAVRCIQRSCRYIIQYPCRNASDNGSHINHNGGSNFLTTLFGTTTNNKSHSPSTSLRITKPRKVRMMVQDSDIDGQPILCIIPLLIPDHENTSNTTTSSSSATAATAETAEATTMTTIKLRRIDKVQLDGDQIVFYGKIPKSRSSSSSSSSSAIELLRFSILLDQEPPPNLLVDYNNNNNEDNNNNNNNNSNDHSIDVLVSTDTRNMMVHYWMVLVEWERQRRNKLVSSSTNSNTTTNINNNRDNVDSDTEEEEEESHNNTNSTNFITRHTQKIQHYAQREMELQRIKRQREVRKAQLLSQTNGGLKYTALAMATLQSHSQQS